MKLIQGFIFGQNNSEELSILTKKIINTAGLTLEQFNAFYIEPDYSQGEDEMLNEDFYYTNKGIDWAHFDLLDTIIQNDNAMLLFDYTKAQIKTLQSYSLDELAGIIKNAVRSEIDMGMGISDIGYNQHVEELMLFEIDDDEDIDDGKFTLVNLTSNEGYEFDVEMANTVDYTEWWWHSNIDGDDVSYFTKDGPDDTKLPVSLFIINQDELEAIVNAYINTSILLETEIEDYSVIEDYIINKYLGSDVIIRVKTPDETILYELVDGYVKHGGILVYR